MRKSLKEIVLDFFKEHPKEGFFVDQITQAFGWESSADFKALVKVLAQLEEEEEIIITKKGTFRYALENQPLIGTYRANAKGFGFVTVTEGEPDIFIPRGQSLQAMEGDKVKIRLTKSASGFDQKASEGRVIEVVERATNQVVGIYTRYNSKVAQEKGYTGWVVIKDQQLKGVTCQIRQGGLHPVDGTVVIVELVQYQGPGGRMDLEGLVVKEIGYKDQVGMDILMILAQLKIPTEFPQAVLDQAQAVPESIQAEDLQGRRDLRGDLTVTIDGADAKDLDDAIGLQRREDGTFVLTVSIADVSYYVTEGSPLDQEAYNRATSVYLTDRVVPMLPQRLSNGICSLHPHEDRLTMTCQMEIDRSGTIYSYDIFPSIIHSDARLTYSQVNQVFDGDQAAIQDLDPAIVDMLGHMKDLHLILERRRKQRGAIDFDTHEAKILVDEQGAPLDIQIRTRGLGERLIESFMLAANETVAGHFTRLKLPFIYRIHEQPAPEKMQRFLEFITAFGLSIKGTNDAISPKKLQQALDQIKGETYEAVVSTMMLRSMKQAKYDTAPSGHYGLAAEDYTHFTSPIRRYPDLIVHRMIRNYQGMTGSLSQDKADLLESKLDDIAQQSSRMERLAVQAEREVDSLKKAEYMQDKIGQTFEAIISSVTRFGIFVELPNTVEGLIHITQLQSDYFHFVESHLTLIGETTGVTYHIGDKVKVRLVKVDVEAREIDFVLEEDYEEDRTVPGFKSNRPFSKGSSGPDKGKTPHASGKHRGKGPKSKGPAKEKGPKSAGKKKGKSGRQSFKKAAKASKKSK